MKDAGVTSDHWLKPCPTGRYNGDYQIPESRLIHVKAAVDSIPASAPPWQVVVSGSSLRAVISQLLTQVSPGSRSPVKFSTIFQETQRLLLSSFPWLAKSIMAHLEKELVPWNGLEKALLTTPHIFQHYAVYLVAHSIARLVPDQLEASQEDLLRMEWVLKSLPPGSMLTVSSDLVDDLLVQLMLRLHPLNGEGYRQLNQQTLLTVTLKMSCLILATVRKMPGITVDTSLPCPGWDIRRLAMLVQCSLIKSFGTPLQGPNMLYSILWEVVEALLAQYHSVSPEETSIPTQAPRVEQEMEERLLSQTLPEQVREQLYLRFGKWVQHSKLLCRALPSMSTTEQNLRGGDPPVNINTLGDNPVTLDGSLDALQKEHPDSHSCCDQSMVENSSCGPVVTGDLLPPAAQPVDRDSDSVSTTDMVLIQRSTVGLIVAQLFRGRDQMSSQSHILRYRAFQKLVVQEVHLLLQKEATMYQNNHGFQQTLERLMDPKQKERLKEAFPGMCLSREGLMEDPQNTLLACALIATEAFDYLKTSVSFPDDVKEAEEKLHGEHKQFLTPPEDPQNTLLASSVIITEVLQCPKTSVSFPDDVKGAECLYEEGTKLLTSPKETMEVKKKKRRCFWLRRLFTCKSK
ncbi:unnamed protein product [Lota lota]